MKRKTALALSLLLFAGLGSICQAAQDIVALKVNAAPVIDGTGEDPVWEKAQAIVTHDKIADIDITLKAVYTDKKIFFLVSFADPDESRTHKSWQWDEKKKIYGLGKDREDSFVFKWNMEPIPVDLSVQADNPYATDIWYWKAFRTDPVGYADDKMHILGAQVNGKDGTKVISKSENIMYLLRKGDKGRSAYKTVFLTEYKGDVVPRFTNRKPTSSRADVKVKSMWRDGSWTLELSRLLNTGNEDDVQFEETKSFQFGVSRYEIAARLPDPGSTQPLHGAGDVGEIITLIFR